MHIKDIRELFDDELEPSKGSYTLRCDGCGTTLLVVIGKEPQDWRVSYGERICPRCICRGL